MKQVIAVRGATTIAEDTVDAYQSALIPLIEALFSQNKIKREDIISVFFTVTPDLTCDNPARLVREYCDGWNTVPMMCSQEAQVNGMLARCVRVLIQYYSDVSHRPTPVYLGAAKDLRPDLAP